MSWPIPIMRGCLFLLSLSPFWTGCIFALDNLYYYRLEHQNANVARNYGILHSKGRYIAILDADDEWFRNHLEVNMELIKTTECDGVYSSIEMRTPHKNIRVHGEMFSRLNGKSCEEIYNGIFPDISAWQCVGFKMFYYHPHDSDDSNMGINEKWPEF